MKKKILILSLVSLTFISSCGSNNLSVDQSVNTISDSIIDPDKLQIENGTLAPTETLPLPGVEEGENDENSSAKEDEIISDTQDDSSSAENEENSTTISEDDDTKDPVLDDIGGEKDIIEIPAETEPEYPHKETYVVTFMNADGTNLSTQECEYGSLPDYESLNPALPSNDKYRYEFKGWSPEVKEVTEDAIYTAQYKETKLFDVDVYDKDRLIDSIKEEYKSEEIDFNEENYNRPDTTKYTYEFTGYQEEISQVTGDEIYHTTYKESLRTYSVSYYDQDSNLIKTEELEYGSLPVFPVDKLQLDENEYLSSISDSNGLPISCVTQDAYYFAHARSTHFATFSYEYNGEMKSTSLPIDESGCFTLPHFLNNDVYFINESTNERFLQNTPLYLNADTIFSVHKIVDNINPQIVTSKNEGGEVTLEKIKFSDTLPQMYSLPTYVFDEESESLLPISILGNGSSPIFQFPNYDQNNSLVSINIPTIVKTISSNAFTNLETLKYVNIPETLGDIKTNAFKDDYNLNLYVHTSKENTSFARILDEYKLLNVWYQSGMNYNYTYSLNDGGDNLYQIAILLINNKELMVTDFTILEEDENDYQIGILPEQLYLDNEVYKVTKIGAHAFEGVTSLDAVSLHESINQIGDSAFKNCESLMLAQLPNSITSIPDHCFENDSILYDVNLHDGIKSIGDYAFKNTLISNVEDAFYIDNKYEITNSSLIRLPAFLTDLGDYAFENVNSTYFLIPKYLKKLGEKAFNNSNSLLLFEHKSISELNKYTTELGVDYATQTFWNIRETLSAIPDFEK